MKTLTPQQMDAVRNTPPVALKVQDTPSGPVTFSITPVGGEFAVSTQPFEVIGAYEAHPSLPAALSRMLTSARAVARDSFPPPITTEQAV